MSTSPLVVLGRSDVRIVLENYEALLVAQGCSSTSTSAAARIGAALDAPPTHAVIPLEDARAIQRWVDAGVVISQCGGASIGTREAAEDAIDRLVASLPPEHPPWEPSEEQITAYQGLRDGWVISRMVARDSLIAARAVFDREGIEG